MYNLGMGKRIFGEDCTVHGLREDGRGGGDSSQTDCKGETVENWPPMRVRVMTRILHTLVGKEQEKSLRYNQNPQTTLRR